MSTAKQLVLASNNPGKLKEFQQLLDQCGYRVLPQSDFKVADAEETGLSFVENAIIKARHASKLSDLPALADDSGLEVDALKGAPGIYSARFSGPDATDARNNQQLLEQLAEVPEEKRSARFQCVLAFMRHPLDPTPIICQGSWEGKILQAADGNNGFGYDPLFFVPELGCSSAALSKQKKNEISHRGRAIAQLLTRLKG